MLGQTIQKPITLVLKKILEIKYIFAKKKSVKQNIGY
jgi:hypothetical protein